MTRVNDAVAGLTPAAKKEAPEFSDHSKSKEEDKEDNVPAEAVNVTDDETEEEEEDGIHPFFI